MSDGDVKKYDKVLERFEGHFDKSRNTVYERAKFNRRSQREGETVDEFFTDLFRLVEHCKFGDLQDEHRWTTRRRPRGGATTDFWVNTGIRGDES